MKRAFVFALLALAVFAGVAQAGGSKIGIGPYAGITRPIIQDDTGGGMVYGVRAPLSFIPVITLEPFFASSNLGDKDQTIGGLSYTRTGFDMTAFGVSALLGSVGGSGLKFYPFGGIGSYKLTRTGSEDIKETGWNFGLGLGIPAGSKISVQIRGEVDAIITGDTSRKFAGGTVGLNYNLMSSK